MIELFVPALGLTRLFPKLVGAMNDIFFGGVFHFFAFMVASTAPTAVQGSL
jgi:hypothetical protein